MVLVPRTYLHLVPVRQSVLDNFVLIQLYLGPILFLLPRVVRHICDRLLNVPDDLLLRAGVEHVATLPQQRL